MEIYHTKHNYILSTKLTVWVVIKPEDMMIQSIDKSHLNCTWKNGAF